MLNSGDFKPQLSPKAPVYLNPDCARGLRNMAKLQTVKSGASSAIFTADNPGNSGNFGANSGNAESLSGLSRFSFVVEVSRSRFVRPVRIPLHVHAPDSTSAAELVRATAREFYGAAFVGLSAS